jgi:methylenetetrahydrofolate reductase (NADPH)
MWELNQTSAWLNFHLGRDHQNASAEIVQRCRISNFRHRPMP